MRRLMSGALALALAVGCSGGAEGEAGGRKTVEAALPDPGRTPDPSAPPDTVPPRGGGGEWTASIVETALPGIRMTTLTQLRTARHPGFDRVVLEFAGDTLPRYRAEYVDRPVRQCGSGEAVEIAGDGWLSISLSPARAHDEQGRPTIEDREREPGLPVLKELQLVCDFEGQVVWVLGVASPNRFRILELEDPTRLVVDVRH